MPIMLVLLQALLLVACGHHRPQKIPRLGSEDIILAFGDSLTYGSGAAPTESYPVQLSQLANRHVVNAGVPGEITQAGLARLPAILDDTQPKLVILCMGGNDMLRRLDKAQMKSNLAAMIREIKGRNIAVLLLAVPKPALIGMNADPAYAELAEEWSVPLDDETLPELLSDRSRKSDGIHLNALGYRELAEAITRQLRENDAL